MQCCTICPCTGKSLYVNFDETSHKKWKFFQRLTRLRLPSKISSTTICHYIKTITNHHLSLHQNHQPLAVTKSKPSPTTIFHYIKTITNHHLSLHQNHQPLSVTASKPSPTTICHHIKTITNHHLSLHQNHHQPHLSLQHNHQSLSVTPTQPPITICHYITTNSFEMVVACFRCEDFRSGRCGQLAK